jgi:NAD(P)-dependent dehydrogenase (short-subunit alcohol dehydrogenase family)
MRARGSGLVMQIGSVAGRIAFPFFSVYHASKWALEGYSQGLRAELASSGVDVVMVEPGPFRTALLDRSPQPTDADGRGATYPSVARETRDQLMAGFGESFSRADEATEPAHVVDRMIELIAMPAGTRPFRSVVGADFGAREVNDRCEPIYAAALTGFGLAEFATLRTGTPVTAIR